MKRFFLSVLLLCSTAAMAEEDAWPTMPHAYAGQNNLKSAAQIRFERHKAEMLKRGEERAAEIQQNQACIEAAATPESLKRCSLGGQEDRDQASESQNNRNRDHKAAGRKK